MATPGPGKGIRKLEGLGRASLPSTLGSVLSLVSDAVIAFDGTGRIILSNEEAERLYQHGEEGLFGAQVAGLFPGAAPVSPADSATRSQGAEPGVGGLPFPFDGSSAMVSCLCGDGAVHEVRVRCERCSFPGETYVLVAHAADSLEAQDREQQRLVEDLSRANHRLSGTLRIILDTLDADDMSVVFSRVLEEIADTMEASGTVIYLAEPDGFHLRGHTASLDDARLPKFLSYGRGLDRMLMRSDHAVRLRVSAPQAQDLRSGRLASRDVVDEETHVAHRMPARLLPPFASFIAVPVWFGGHVIAIIEVGWERIHPTDKEDGRLLDAVASYLSVQLMGAFAQMRAEHASHLESLSSELRERLMSTGEPTEEDYQAYLEGAAEGIGAILVPVACNDYQRTSVATLPKNGMRALPQDVDDIVGSTVGHEASVVPIRPGSELSAWLQGLGECSIGAFVDAGRIDDRRVCFMMLRPADAEPFDNDDLTFLRRCAEDLADIAQGTQRRLQDKRISQALQSGMRNELQKVDGLTAAGIYSSATADAFVGGDFYDLIRLPERKAAVIMGDVSGKGVEAASVSAAVKTALGAYAWEGLTPARMVRSLNDFLLGFSRIETFATLFIGVIDLATGRLTYCSAGHPPAILRRARTGELETLDVQSGVVGAFEDMDYRDGEVQVQVGDFLLLYTDGTTEARSPSGAFFGEDGLKDALVKQAAAGFDGILDRLLATLDSFTARNLDDDVAMVAVRFDEIG